MASDATSWDNDGDGVHSNDGDCDDNNADVNRMPEETPGDGVDSNCNGRDVPRQRSEHVRNYTIVRNAKSIIFTPNDCQSTQPVKPISGLAMATLLGLTACDAKPSDTMTQALYGAEMVDTAYMDFDGDGYSPADGDCDDDNADVNPDAEETLEMVWIQIVTVKTIPNRNSVCIFLSTLLWTACSDTHPKQVEQTCNGSTRLCDRPLNEVLFAGTHNAMSSTEDDWSFPNQEYAFTRQLEDGIRALILIPTGGMMRRIYAIPFAN